MDKINYPKVKERYIHVTDGVLVILMMGALLLPEALSGNLDATIPEQTVEIQPPTHP